MKNQIGTLLLLVLTLSTPDFVLSEECSPRKQIIKNGVKAEIRTTCLFGGKYTSEFQKGKRNGESIAYFKDGKIESISLYRDDLKEDSTMVWDSLGNLRGKYFYHRGNPVGVDKSWGATGELVALTTYDSLGRKHGLDAEWWPDGKKNSELFYAANVCTLAIDYYRNGNKKTLARHPNIPHVEITPQKTSSGESWSWSGKSIAKITQGNGYEIRLPRDFNDTTKRLKGLIGRYKDSLLVEIKELDSAAVMKYK